MKTHAFNGAVNRIIMSTRDDHHYHHHQMANKNIKSKNITQQRKQSVRVDAALGDGKSKGPHWKFTRVWVDRTPGGVAHCRRFSIPSPAAFNATRSFVRNGFNVCWGALARARVCVFGFVLPARVLSLASKISRGKSLQGSFLSHSVLEFGQPKKRRRAKFLPNGFWGGALNFTPKAGRNFSAVRVCVCLLVVK